MRKMVLAASSVRAVLGHWCSPPDFSIMKETSDSAAWNGTFMQIKLECMRASYNSSFDYNNFVSCLAESTGLGSSCSKCFAEDAEYSASNCQDVCTATWQDGADMGEACRNCTEDNEDKLVECVVEGSVPNVTAALSPCRYGGRRRKFTIPGTPPPTPRPTLPTTTTTTTTFQPPPLASISGGDFLMSGATLATHLLSSLAVLIFWVVLA